MSTHDMRIARKPDTMNLQVSAWLTNLEFDWADLTQGSRKQCHAMGDTLFHEGQLADTIYVIESGRVRLTSYSLDGKERHLMVLGPTALVGDCGLLSSACYLVSAIAATDLVVSTIQLPTFLKALSSNSKVLQQQLKLGSLRFRIMMKHLSLQGPNSGQRKVCQHLLGLMYSYGVTHKSGTAISIAFTHQEMANICGLSRVSVSNIFSALERDNVILRSARLVVVQDEEKLASLSQT